MWSLLLACSTSVPSDADTADGRLVAPQELDLVGVALASLDTSDATTMDRINHVHDLLVSVEAPGTDAVFAYLNHLVLWEQSVADVSEALGGLDEDGHSVMNGIEAALTGDGSAWTLTITPPDADGWTNTAATRGPDGWTVDFYDPFGSGDLQVEVVRTDQRAAVEYFFEGSSIVSSTAEPQSGSLDTADGHVFDFELASDGSGWLTSYCPLDGLVEMSATLTGASSGEACVAVTACCDEAECSPACVNF